MSIFHGFWMYNFWGSLYLSLLISMVGNECLIHIELVLMLYQEKIKEDQCQKYSTAVIREIRVLRPTPNIKLPLTKHKRGADDTRDCNPTASKKKRCVS
jgi:hypothetical protein